MSASPAFAATPRNSAVAVSTANTARDGTGTVPTVFTAGATGSRVEEIRAHASGQTAAAILTVFINDGSTSRIIAEFTIPAITPSTTVAAFDSGPLQFDNLELPTGWSIRAAITVAPVSGVVNVFALGGDY